MENWVGLKSACELKLGSEGGLLSRRERCGEKETTEKMQAACDKRGNLWNRNSKEAKFYLRSAGALGEERYRREKRMSRVNENIAKLHLAMECKRMKGVTSIAVFSVSGG